MEEKETSSALRAASLEKLPEGLMRSLASASAKALVNHGGLDWGCGCFVALFSLYYSKS